MITSINDFKKHLNENLLIPRRSKEERNLKLWQNNYKKLCDNETYEGKLLIDYRYDFPATFDTSNLKLKTINGNVRILLNYMPKWLQNVTINGNFYCYDIGLTSLQYAPTMIYGDFDCSYNKLTSLEYCPNFQGDFNCQSNLLTSLEGCPTIIEGYFNCQSNHHLSSLKGCPSTIHGNFDCSYNAKQFTEEEVRSVSKIYGKLFN